MAVAVNAAYNDTIYGTNPNGSFSIAYNSTRYYAQDRVRKIEAAKKADILRTVKAATKAVVNSATKLAESIKSTSPAVTETAQNEWWKNNSQTYLGPAQMMGGVMGIDIRSYLNSSTYNIVQKILEFRENHPILYTLALIAAIGLISAIASGPIQAIAGAALFAGVSGMGSAVWATVIQIFMHKILGEDEEAAALADKLPEVFRNGFEIGAIVGAIAQALSMIFEWIAEKISTLWGKAKDWLKGETTPTPQGTEGVSGTRPTWRQSEIDAKADYPDYNEQVSFLNGEEVPYGTKGSVRPDYYKPGSSVDIKNYNIETASGRSNLTNNISNQYYQRNVHLPQGTKQSVLIDIRGQNVSNSELEALYNSIMERTNNGITIYFKTY